MAILQREVHRASVRPWVLSRVQSRVRVKGVSVWKDGHRVKERCVCDELASYDLVHPYRPFGWTSMPCSRVELVGLAQPMAEVGLERKDQMERCHLSSFLERSPFLVVWFRQKQSHRSSRP